MARSHSVRGLSSRALNFIKDEYLEGTPSSRCVECAFSGKVISTLFNYYRDDILLYEEVVQAEPWNGGPTTFTTLRGVYGEDFPELDWTNEEIHS